MIAQKLKNNRIAITSGSVGRKDALETIEDLKVSEFFKLSRAARNWEKSLNDKRDIMFTTYENENSKVCKEFDSIYQRRKFFLEMQQRKLEEESFKSLLEEINSKRDSINVSKDNINENIEITNDVTVKNKKSTIVKYVSDVKGTSKLIRIPSKKTIKIVKRRGPHDNKCSINCICIDNKKREEFFSDVKKLQHFVTFKVYEIMYGEESKEFYEKWDKFMDDTFERNTQTSTSTSPVGSEFLEE